MFVLSLGEAILFPTMNIQIARLAPAHLRGSYFGATSFYSFGYALAPLVGGFMVEYYSGEMLFQLTSGLVFVTVFLYLISGKCTLTSSHWNMYLAIHSTEARFLSAISNSTML